MSQAIPRCQLELGTTGWSIDDFYELDVLGELTDERLEIVDGVLTKLVPQGFECIDPLSQLRRILDDHRDATGQDGLFYHKVDVLLRRNRVARPDMVFLSDEQRAEQEQITRQLGLSRARYRPIYVVPGLVVESVSDKHEDHDRLTKVEWYSQFRVPHYWLLTAFETSLVCLVLQDGQYVEEARGFGDENIQTGAFGGISIPLSKLWDQ